MEKACKSYGKVFLVEKALAHLGPGMHSATRLTECCREILAEARAFADTPLSPDTCESISRASVDRILRAGRDQGFFAYDAAKGLYGLPQWAPHPDDAHQVRLQTVEGGPLAHECRTLQRVTSQVITVHALSIVDSPAARLLRHHDLGTRKDFQRALLDRPQARRNLIHAPLDNDLDDQDAAALVLLAHMAPPREPLLRMIRSEGYAHTPSPIPGWETVSAPLWYGCSVMGALSLHSRTDQMQRHRLRYLRKVTTSAAGLSRIFDASTAAAA